MISLIVDQLSTGVDKEETAHERAVLRLFLAPEGWHLRVTIRASSTWDGTFRAPTWDIFVDEKCGDSPPTLIPPSGNISRSRGVAQA